MEPLQWVDLTRSRPLGNVCYLRIDVKRTLRIELRMSPFGGKRPSNTATLAAEWRPYRLYRGDFGEPEGGLQVWPSWPRFERVLAGIPR